MTSRGTSEESTVRNLSAQMGEYTNSMLCDQTQKKTGRVSLMKTMNKHSSMMRRTVRKRPGVTEKDLRRSET